MLFDDFFPRLQARARDRYGVSITERQFRDWREDGLIAGPAKPIGQGRGRAPQRHWPNATYRRALRICRYKGRGAHRTSQWWIGFWLSGEQIAIIEPKNAQGRLVPVDVVRSALKREFSIARRAKRSLAESDRWLRSKFNTVEDVALGDPTGGSASGIIRLLGITPDQFRRITIQQFEEPSDREDIDLLNEILPRIYRLDTSEPIAGDEWRTFWRVGHMGEGRKYPGGYLDDVTESDLRQARTIFRLYWKSAFLNYGLTITREDFLFEDMMFPLFGFIGIYSDFNIPGRLDYIFQILFNMTETRREGADPARMISEIEGNQRQVIELIRQAAAERGKPDFAAKYRDWQRRNDVEIETEPQVDVGILPFR